MNDALAFAWVADNEDRLRDLVRSVVGQSDVLIDEVMSEVIVERAPRLLQTWRPDLGSWDMYACCSLRDYAIKWLRRRERLHARYVSEDQVPELEEEPDEWAERTELVEAALDVLSPTELIVVLARFWHGDSLARIAEDTDSSVSTVRRVLATAMERMRLAPEVAGLLISGTE